MEENEKQKKLIDSLFQKEWKDKHVCWGGGIEITTNCNFKCIHCYLEGSHNVDNSMPLSMFKNIVDQLYDNGVIFVYLTGGEIFTHKNFKDMYLYLKQKGFIVELLTNISLLNDDLVSLFKEYPPFNISISIYGSNENEYNVVTKNPYSFNLVKNSIKKLIDNDIPFELKTPVLKETIPFILKIKELANKQNIKFIYFDNIFPIFDESNSNENHRATAKEVIELESKDDERVKLWSSLHNSCSYKKNKDIDDLYLCHYGSDSFFITYDGYVEGCNKMRLKKWNINQYSFKQCWDLIDVERKRKVKANNYDCLNCFYSRICQPCPADNVLFNGDELKAPKIKCEKCKLRFEKFK